MAAICYLYNLCMNSKQLEDYKPLLMLLQALIVRLKKERKLKQLCKHLFKKE